jgi:hypothetical protein
LRKDDYEREKRKLENTDNVLLVKRTTTQEQEEIDKVVKLKPK